MIKCDFHIHSRYSFDSLANPKDIVQTALKRGLRCIAIADHGNINGSLKAAEYVKANSLPLLIIISEEVKSKSGDILALDIQESIPDHLTADESLARIHGQGGLAIVAHPFGLWCSFKENLENYLGQIDGIEILNASVFKGNKTAGRIRQKTQPGIHRRLRRALCKSFYRQNVAGTPARLFPRPNRQSSHQRHQRKKRHGRR